GQAQGSQSATWASRPVDRRLAQPAGPVPIERHHSLSGGSVTMRRRPSVSRVRENRTHGSKGGWGDGLAERAPRPSLPMTAIPISVREFLATGPLPPVVALGPHGPA